MTGETRSLDDVTDDELLAELHRRFGESWCSFSSGVRSPGECPICNRERRLTRHHLVPIAAGAGRERRLKRRFVKLCRECHDLAHRIWGPGHRFAGPRDREVFIRDLRAAAARHG